MGRIKKAATERHIATVSPFIQEFVKRATETPLQRLPSELDAFPQHWPFPRGDLYHWIPLLDRFDHIIELFNKEYGLNEGPQAQPFERRLLKRGDAEEGQPYPLVGAQPEELDKLGYSSEGDRELVEAVLHFTRILLEHCGNRSLYASSTQINDLLHTTSLSLLRLCLKLGLRLAQRYQVARYKNHHPSAQTVLLANHYNFNLENLNKIAMPFPKSFSSTTALASTPGKGKEKSIASSAMNPSDIVSLAKEPLPATTKSEMSSVALSYYDQSTSGPTQPSPAQQSADGPTSPTPVRRTSNLGPSRDRPSAGQRSASTNDLGLTPIKSREQDASSSSAPKLFNISPSAVSETPAWTLVKEALPNIPSDMRFDLLNRIRIAKAFASNVATTEQLLEIRLLAIANLAYAYNESKFQEKIGTPDGEEPRRYHLAQQLCDLLQPATNGQSGLSLSMETTVLLTLEALTKTRHKVSEVVDALSITVNHGLIYYELRKVIATLSYEQQADSKLELVEMEWQEATFDLINSLLQSNTQARYGEKMVAAGIIDILVEVLGLRTARAQCFHEKVFQFFDSFIHGIPSAFQTLANVKGLDIIAELAAHEVETALQNSRSGKGMPKEFKSQVVDYDIPFYQQSTLRQLFKNTVHMFEHSTGTHDRLLRNLIDTPQILGALRTVIENAHTFGSNVWSGAVNIVTSFIHNEPTSYQVIGEAGLSKSLLESITGQKLSDEQQAKGESSTESGSMRKSASVENGDDRGLAVGGILPVGEVMCDIPTAFGAICLNESGMQLFQTSGALVKYFDIFLSHVHVRAMEEEGGTAATIGQSFDELSRHHPRLKEQILAAVCNMLKRLRQLCMDMAENKDAGAKLWERNSAGLAIAGARSSKPAFNNAEDEHERAPGVQYVSACFKFLDGFLHNSTMTSLFCEESGAELVLDIATSPSNPHDLVAFPLFSKVTQVLKIMCEAKAHLVLPNLLRRTQMAITGLSTLMANETSNACFSSFTDLSAPEQGSLSRTFNGTEVVKSLLNIHMLTHILGRTLAPPPYSLRHGSQINHLFSNLNFTDIYVTLVDSLSRLHASCLWEHLLIQGNFSDKFFKDTDPRVFTMRRVDANGRVDFFGKASETETNKEDEEGAINQGTSKDSREAILGLKNTRVIRYLLSQVPMGIESFFLSLGQAIVTKRSDPAAKQHANLVAEHLANAVIWELEYVRSDAKGGFHMETKYRAQVLAMISRILLRNSYSMEAFGTKEAMTLVLTKFYAAEGFTKLNELLDEYAEALLGESHGYHDENCPLRDAINSILNFYGQIVRPKCINDALQSNVITARERTHPDFFQPGQFLVEIRDAVLPAISSLWHSEIIDRFPVAIVKPVVDILRLILKGEGEERALRRSEKVTRRITTSRPEFKLRNLDGFETVRAMGFEDDGLAREAIYRCNNHVTNAEQYCRLRKKDNTAPRFPVLEHEASGERSSSSRPTSANQHFSTTTSGPSTAANDNGSVGLLDTNSQGAGNEAQLALSSDNDVMSEDENLISMGTLPANLRSDDLRAITDPYHPSIVLPSNRNTLDRSDSQIKDTKVLYVTVDDLDDKRKELHEDLIDTCLDVLSSHRTITFELADLIQAAVAKAGEVSTRRADIGTTLVSSLMSLQLDEMSHELGLKIHAYAHLLALILQDRDFFDSTMDELKEYFDNLVEWVQLDSDQKIEDAPWIEMVLLIIERVLAEDEQPAEVEWEPPPADEPLKPLPSPKTPELVVSSELRSQLFDALVDLLPKIGKNSLLALSVCRVLVVLTRRRDLALRLSDKRTTGRLFLMIRQLAGSLNEKLQSSFMIILRHMIEDDEIIRQVMRAEIKIAFENHRSSRAMDTTTYTRNLHHLVLRNPQAFVEVTQELLEIARFDGNPHRAQSLALKREIPTGQEDPKTTSAAQIEPERENMDQQKPSEARPPMVETTDGVIQFLLRELANYKDVDDKPAKSPQEETAVPDNATADDVEMSDADSRNETPAGSTAELTTTTKPSFKPEDNAIYIYRCFVLQCLAELVGCYNRTKMEFINFSRKSETPNSTPSKPRSGTVNYLLNSLLPVGTLEHRDDAAHRKKVATSNWATHVLVALCSKTRERHGQYAQEFNFTKFSEEEPELTFVRKFVLEHALRAFKDATTSGEPLGQRYARLLALGELFNRMLEGKPAQNRTNLISAHITWSWHHFGRLMYEKNFIGTLTSAIAEVDLNFPNAKRAVKYILGPLKQLTELGVHFSQSPDLSSSSGSRVNTDEDEISSATSMSGDDEDDREQTPDLFRGSSLGMFESSGAQDDDGYDSVSEDDEDDEMYDDEYDEEMEYEENAIADHGEVVSDEDDDLGEMGQVEGMGTNVQMEVDIMMEDQDDGSEDDDDDDEEDEEESQEGHELGVNMEEITGDDENASMGEHDEEGDWEDDGVDFEVEDDEQIQDGGSPHGGPLEHIAHVIGDADPSDPDDHHDMVRIDMGDGEDEFFEDEMPPEDDEDDMDEADFDNDLAYEPEVEDDEDDGAETGWAWGWDLTNPQAMFHGAPHHHHHHHHHHHNPQHRRFNEMLGMMGDPLRPGAFRTHRATPNARDEEGINPLLQREGSNNANNNNRGDRDTGYMPFSPRLGGLRRTLFPRQGEGFLQDLIAAVGPPGNGGVIGVNIDTNTLPGLTGVPSITIQGRPDGHAVVGIDPTRPWRDQLAMGRWPDALPGRPNESRAHPGNGEAQAVEFRPTQTTNRWQEESRMLFPGKFHDKATRVINLLLRALVPAAMEAKRLRDKEEAERKAAEAKAAEEAQKKAEAEKAEREAREKREREEREARERAEAEAEARAQAERDALADTDQAEATSMEGVESDPQDAANAAQSDAQQPQEDQPERIIVTIRGRELDITSLGIDREYIEALPEDIREEVIMAQFAEQRSQAVQSGEGPSEISREFLEALPRDIQQELLRSEAMERRRRERDEARQRASQNGNAAPAQPEEMNNADFMAMLEPALRQAVLMDADDTVLAALPEDLQAEARALFGDRRVHRGEQPPRFGRGLEPGARIVHGHTVVEPAGEGAGEVNRQRRPVLQMLDKAGVATLLRLMFVSLNTKAKLNLHSILADVSKNTQNRAEVISILLSILQDGTADVSAVERIFAQLSLRAKQPAGPKTPHSVKRTLTGPLAVAPNSELSPLNIVQQCLGTLNVLCNDNPRVPSFFLSEHETISSQKGKAVKKGKQSENKAAKFPLNALLVLLDRPLITDNTGIMETLASLLSHVTRPLTILLRRAKEAQEAEKTGQNNSTETEERPQTGASDVSMANASVPGSSQNEGAEIVPPATDDAESEKKDAKVSSSNKKHRDLTPPEVPEENIRLVVNILAARECPSKTFSNTLDIIKNLSAIPGAKEVFGRELIRQAQELGQTLLADLEELAKQINVAQTGTDLQGMALASFSSAGSKQRKLLRVLVALDHLFDPKRIPAIQTSSPSPAVEEKLKEDILALLYESPTFDKLWSSLSTCLAAIRRRGNMVNVATILLPLIESLMVVCRNSALKEMPMATNPISPIETSVSTPPPESRSESLFFNFTEEHRKILNELIRNNPKLMNGNLSILAKNSKVLEFDNKRNYFIRKMHDRRAEGRVSHPSLQLNVRRDQVFLDSFKSLYYKSGNEIKYGKLNIRFHGEEGIDAGGVSREWFAAMARQMFNPNYALFNPVASDRTTFHPNSLSEVNPEHLMFFKFVGRIIGKALFEGRVLDCHFSRAVYRRILGKSVSLKDMETLDLDYYKSLVWILENDITDVTFETFSVDVDRFGFVETVDLVPNGRNIAVTEGNKGEFVRLVVEYRLVKSVQSQLDNFLAGFHDIIPSELVSIFNEQELELLISGLPEIDADDWKNNTEYHNYQPTSPQIQWFWRAVRSFDKEEKAKLLQFVTGTSKVPLNGFKELEGMNGFAKFNIHRDYSSKEKLPSSHTCFNRKCYPYYSSYLFI